MFSSRGPAMTAKTSHVTCNFVAIGAIAQFCQFVGEFSGLKFSNASKFIKGKKNVASCVFTSNIKRGR